MVDVGHGVVLEDSDWRRVLRVVGCMPRDLGVVECWPEVKGCNNGQMGLDFEFIGVHF